MAGALHDLMVSNGTAATMDYTLLELQSIAFLACAGVVVTTLVAQCSPPVAKPTPAGFRRLVDGRLIKAPRSNNHQEDLKSRAKKAYNSGRVTRWQRLQSSLHNSLARCVGVAQFDRMRHLARRCLCQSTDSLPSHLLLGISYAGLTEWLAEHHLIQSGSPPSDDVERATRGQSQVFSGFDLQRVASASSASASLEAESDAANRFSSLEELMHAGSEHVGSATVFVSCPRSTSLRVLLSALDSFLEQHSELPRHSTFFWLADLSSRAPSELREHMSSIIVTIGCTAIVAEPWDQPLALTRAHCLQELSWSRQQQQQQHAVGSGIGGGSIELCMSSAQLKSFEAALVDDVDSAVRAMTKFEEIDIVSASTNGSRAEAETILDGIARAEGGSHDPLADFNSRVRSTIRSAYVQHSRRALGRQPHEMRASSKLVDSVGLMARHAEVATSRDIFGATDVRTLTAINNYAALLKAHRKLRESGLLYSEALAARRASLGSTHPATLTSINNLAAQRFAEGKLGEAETLFAEALAARQSSLGESHPSTLASRHNLATLSWQRAKREHAAALRQQQRLHKKAQRKQQASAASATSLAVPSPTGHDEGSNVVPSPPPPPTPLPPPTKQAAGGGAGGGAGGRGGGGWYAASGRKMTEGEVSFYLSKAKREMNAAEAMLASTLEGRRSVTTPHAVHLHASHTRLHHACLTPLPPRLTLLHHASHCYTMPHTPPLLCLTQCTRCCREHCPPHLPSATI